MDAASSSGWARRCAYLALLWCLAMGALPLLLLLPPGVGLLLFGVAPLAVVLAGTAVANGVLRWQRWRRGDRSAVQWFITAWTTVSVVGLLSQFLTSNGRGRAIAAAVWLTHGALAVVGCFAHRGLSSPGPCRPIGRRSLNAVAWTYTVLVVAFALVSPLGGRTIFYDWGIAVPTAAFGAIAAWYDLVWRPERAMQAMRTVGACSGILAGLGAIGTVHIVTRWSDAWQVDSGATAFALTTVVAICLAVETRDVGVLPRQGRLHRHGHTPLSG